LTGCGAEFDWLNEGIPTTLLVRLLPALLLVAAPSRVGRTETEQAVMLLVVGQATIRPKARLSPLLVQVARDEA
jgi:hypothetical protein